MTPNIILSTPISLYLCRISESECQSHSFGDARISDSDMHDIHGCRTPHLSPFLRTPHFPYTTTCSTLANRNGLPYTPVRCNGTERCRACNRSRQLQAMRGEMACVRHRNQAWASRSPPCPKQTSNRRNLKWLQLRLIFGSAWGSKRRIV